MAECEKRKLAQPHMNWSVSSIASGWNYLHWHTLHLCFGTRSPWASYAESDKVLKKRS